jgi:hypothetical protein
LAAIQKEGLKVWDVSCQEVFVSCSFFAAIDIDAVGLALIVDMVGHNGKHSHKVQGTHYYSTWLKPTNFSITECNHGNVDLNTLFAAHSSKAQYKTDLDFLIRSP